MRNFRNNKRRFRSNSFDRNLKAHSRDQNLGSSFSNVSEIKKRNFSRNNFNSTKLIQKYSELAREALSGGDKILYEKNIFITPGTVFGSQGEGYIRFSLCVSEEIIIEAINRFKS